jgi:hypothetical protein
MPAPQKRRRVAGLLRAALLALAFLCLAAPAAPRRRQAASPRLLALPFLAA